MKKQEKHILHPQFLCIETDDIFWRNVFEHLAYNVCPTGTYIDNDTFICHIKGKQFSYYFGDKSLSEIYDTIKPFLENTLHITSSNDYNIRKQSIEQLQVKYWKDIKKKHIKDILIVNYVIKLYKKHNLPVQRGQYILNRLTMGFAFKLISSDDVVYNPETREIDDIKNYDLKI